MKPAFALSSSLLAIALSSAPSIAQQSPQDFSLPPGGTPTPTPEVEGPANEAAGVEIAPRRILRPTPTPAATPTPTPATARPVSEPTPTPAPSTARPTAAPASTTPRPTGTPAAREQVPATSAETQAPATSDTDNPVPPLVLPTPEPITPTQQSPEKAVASSPSALPDWWPWAAGLIAALLSGAAGGWAFARRRASAGPAQIEPPIVPASGGAGTSAPPLSGERVKTNVAVESLMRSMMMLTLKFETQIANRQYRALRDVRLSADLISAKRNLPMEQQMASPQSGLTELSRTDRIGPQQMGSLRCQLQMPVSELEIFQQGQTPLCVPILRLRIEAEGIEPQHHTFLLGHAPVQPGGRVQPLPLSGPPGGYADVQAKRLEVQP